MKRSYHSDPEVRAKRLASCREYALQHPEQVAANLRRRKLMCKFGITVEQYNALLTEQNGKCALCRKPPNGIRLAVDHDHRTKGIRGLLCRSCNQGLGIVEKRFSILSLHFYLNRPQMKGGRT